MQRANKVPCNGQIKFHARANKVPCSGQIKFHARQIKFHATGKNSGNKQIIPLAKE
jgi:hypothetical protein